MPRSGLYPIKSLVRTQVIEKQTSNSRASGFHSKSSWVFWVGCSNPGRIQGRPLTLSTNRPLPAFFADTGEGVSIDHTGASIMTGVRQAATVSSYKTKSRSSKITFQRTQGGLKGQNQTQGNAHFPRAWWQITSDDGLAHSKSHLGAEGYLYYRLFLPSHQDTCT